MKHVAISILNFNGQKETDNLLDSLSTLDLSDISLTVIVLDNGSKVPYRNSRTYQEFRLIILEEHENLGFSGGHNVAIKRALAEKAEFVLVLNNDTTVDKFLLIYLLEVFVSQKSVGIVVPKIYFAKGSEYHKDRYKKNELGRVLWYAGGLLDWHNVLVKHRGVDEVDTGQYDTLSETDVATGCCLLLSSAVVQNSGMFDERYFLYFEDSDLSERIKRKGFKIIFEPKAVVWHANASSTGGSGSDLQDYYLTRNRMLFGMEYAPLRARLALIRESIRLFGHGRRMQKEGIRDYYLRHFGKGNIQHA